MGLRLAHPLLCTVLALETACDFLLCLICALAASDCTPCFACAVSTMSCDAHKGSALPLAHGKSLRLSELGRPVAAGAPPASKHGTWRTRRPCFT